LRAKNSARWPIKLNSIQFNERLRAKTTARWQFNFNAIQFNERSIVC